MAKELKGVKTDHLEKECPAFKQGCPYAKVEDKQMKDAVDKCPEFKSGCPFKDAKSLAEVHEKLSHVPHSTGHESELSGQKLTEMFKKMYDTSECLEEKLGDCPVQCFTKIKDVHSRVSIPRKASDWLNNCPHFMCRVRLLLTH